MVKALANHNKYEKGKEAEEKMVDLMSENDKIIYYLKKKMARKQKRMKKAADELKYEDKWNDELKLSIKTEVSDSNMYINIKYNTVLSIMLLLNRSSRMLCT